MWGHTQLRARLVEGAGGSAASPRRRLLRRVAGCAPLWRVAPPCAAARAMDRVTLRLAASHVSVSKNLHGGFTLACGQGLQTDPDNCRNAMPSKRQGAALRCKLAHRFKYLQREWPTLCLLVGLSCRPWPEMQAAQWKPSAARWGARQLATPAQWASPRRLRLQEQTQGSRCQPRAWALKLPLRQVHTRRVTVSMNMHGVVTPAHGKVLLTWFSRWTAGTATRSNMQGTARHRTGACKLAHQAVSQGYLQWPTVGVLPGQELRPLLFLGLPQLLALPAA